MQKNIITYMNLVIHLTFESHSLRLILKSKIWKPQLGLVEVPKTEQLAYRKSTHKNWLPYINKYLSSQDYLEKRIIIHQLSTLTKYIYNFQEKICSHFE